MKTRLLWAIIIGFAMLLFGVQPVSADGIIIPDPCPKGAECPVPPYPTCRLGIPCPPPPRPISQLIIRNHIVKVSIKDQVAVTRVSQVFYNPNDRAIEGTYIFPLPADAFVSEFSMWVDGSKVEGKVLDAKEARKVYEEIVRKQNDPALLEYVGRGAVQARIFPIGARQERKIELEYSQVLTAQGGLVRYIYPLSTEKFSTKPLEKVSIQVEIQSKQALRAVYSPTHAVAVDRKSNNLVQVGYEANNLLPAIDYELFYSIGESEGLHLLTYRDPGDPSDTDGYFLLLLAPRPDEDVKPVAKDVILVLDKSGSMDGEKFRQAQAALKYILKKLGPEDRFHLLTFSTGIEAFARDLRPVSEVNEAISWVDRLSAVGSTDINRALLEAIHVVDKERPTYLIFLTDGLPTIGVIKSQDILRNFQAAAPKNVRLFAFGVGYDVDTYLLDTLSQDQHGLSMYVKPGQAIDEMVTTFYGQISTPVLTNIRLDFGKITTYDIYPNPLPDLFAGNQVVIAGRYRQSGATSISLQGEVNGERKVYSFPEQIFSEDSRYGQTQITAIPRLWATRKIGYLLNKIRLQGGDQETINQIVRLSIRFGIVTQYTSYLVTEPMPLGAEGQRKVADEEYRKMQAQPTAAPSGQKAVERADEQGKMAGANQAPPVPQEANRQVKAVGARTFVYKDGIWMDTTYDPKTMMVQKVQYLSESYFSLIDARPEIGPAFALGSRVIVVVDKKAYESSEEGGEPIQVPATITPTPKGIANTRNETPTPGSIPTVRSATKTQEITRMDPAASPKNQAPGNIVVAFILGFGLLILLGAGIGLGIMWGKRGRKEPY
ncbi:MAG TPA: VIT domain-containing protein [Anaerolineaceae bacterium]